MTSSWRGFARDWSCVISALNHFNVWVCRASAGECKGRTPQPAKLNRLLNWLFCCKWNRFGQSLHKLRISVSWGACYCFSMTPLSPAPPNLRCPELRTDEENGSGQSMEKVRDGRLGPTSLSAGIRWCRFSLPAQSLGVGQRTSLSIRHWQSQFAPLQGSVLQEPHRAQQLQAGNTKFCPFRIYLDLEKNNL